MRLILVAAPVLLFAGLAVAQSEGRSDPRDPGEQVPPVEYRSAFEGYRPFAEQELRDWRKSNDEVGAAGGHAGHRPGQGVEKGTPKSQPGKTESSGAPAHHGHGGHK